MACVCVWSFTNIVAVKLADISVVVTAELVSKLHLCSCCLTRHYHYETVMWAGIILPPDLIWPGHEAGVKVEGSAIAVLIHALGGWTCGEAGIYKANENSFPGSRSCIY